MGKRGLKMNLKGGRPLTGDGLIDVFLAPLQLAGFVIQASWQREAPVKSGFYRRSVNTGKPQRRGRGAVVYVGTAVVYAHYQNTRTRNRGHIERAVMNGTPKAIEVFRNGVNTNQLWVRA